MSIKKTPLAVNRIRGNPPFPEFYRMAQRGDSALSGFYRIGKENAGATPFGWIKACSSRIRLTYSSDLIIVVAEREANCIRVQQLVEGPHRIPEFCARVKPLTSRLKV